MGLLTVVDLVIPPLMIVRLIMGPTMVSLLRMSLVRMLTDHQQLG